MRTTLILILSSTAEEEEWIPKVAEISMVWYNVNVFVVLAYFFCLIE